MDGAPSPHLPWERNVTLCAGTSSCKPECKCELIGQSLPVLPTKPFLAVVGFHLQKHTHGGGGRLAAAGPRISPVCYLPDFNQMLFISQSLHDTLSVSETKEKYKKCLFCSRLFFSFLSLPPTPYPRPDTQSSRAGICVPRVLSQIWNSYTL